MTFQVGGELELLLEKEGRPLEWKDWGNLMESVHESRGLPLTPKTDLLTGALVGFQVGEIGVLSCDSSASLAELAASPGSDKAEFFSNLSRLYQILHQTTESIGARIVWGSQYPGRVTKEDYWNRVARKGAYPIARKIWGWKHHELHLSAAFQPAIDVAPENIASYLNAAHVTSPISIFLFGGSAPSAGNEDRIYYEYRMHAWNRMMPVSLSELDTLGIRQFSDASNYLHILLSQKSRLVALRGGSRTGELAYFDSQVKGKQAIEGAPANLVREIQDFRHDKFRTDRIMLSGRELINQMDSWTFLDSRWRFQMDREGSFTKSYVEIRNIGTPDSYEKLEPITDFFIMLRERSEEVNQMAKRHEAWSNAGRARSLVIRDGRLPENHMALLEAMRDRGMVTGKKLHKALAN